MYGCDTLSRRSPEKLAQSGQVCGEHRADVYGTVGADLVVEEVILGDLDVAVDGARGEGVPADLTVSRDDEQPRGLSQRGARKKLLGGARRLIEGGGL